MYIRWMQETSRSKLSTISRRRRQAAAPYKVHDTAHARTSVADRRSPATWPGSSPQHGASPSS